METKKSSLNIDDVKTFIEKAVKLGKYPVNTAAGFSAAIKTAEKALLDEPSNERSKGKRMPFVTGRTILCFQDLAVLTRRCLGRNPQYSV